MHEVRYTAAAAVVVGSSCPNPKRRKQVVLCRFIKRVFTTCTPWIRRLSTGDGANRARGTGCYQLPWYRPEIILLLLLPCLLCCVVRDREVRDFMRADIDNNFFGVLDVHFE